MDDPQIWGYIVVVSKILGGLLSVSLLTWIGIGLLRDVKYLNRNAVLKEDIAKEFADMRQEQRRLHEERMDATRAMHNSNGRRFDGIEDLVKDNEKINREARCEQTTINQQLLMRIEQVNAESIRRDGEVARVK